MTDSSEERIYRIQHNTGYGIVAGIRNGEQHLMMFARDEYLDLVFSPSGDLLSVRRLTYSPSADARGQKAAIVEGLDRTRPIQVKEFFLPEWDIGIKKYPTNIEESIAEMDSYDDEGREELQRDIEAWNRSGDFVLHWSREYFLDESGRAISS